MTSGAVASPVAVAHVPIDELRPDPANPRWIGDDELEALTRSLRRFGFVEPVLARREDRVQPGRVTLRGTQRRGDAAGVGSLAPVTGGSDYGRGRGMDSKPSVADELAKLIALREAGELTDAEFARLRVNLMTANAGTASAAPPAASAAGGAPTSTAPSSATPDGSLPAPSQGTPALLSGLAWLVTAGLTGYLASQQWTLSQQLTALGLPDQSLSAYAGWNVLTALVTLYFGARLLRKPTRSLLTWSVVWGALSVVSGALQLGSGTGNDIFVLSIIVAAAAGVLSYVARQGSTDSVAVSRRSPASPAMPAASLAPVAQDLPRHPNIAPGPPADSRSRTAERVVIALIVLAVLGGGALVILKMQAAQIVANVASSIPTVRPTSAVTVAPAPIYAGSGIITFGTSYDPDTLLINGPTSRFKRTFPEIAWSAEMTRPFGSTSVTWVIASQSSSGVETTLISQDQTVGNPDFDLLANSADLAFLVDNKAGTYVMRYIESGEILAEGTFTLVR